MGTIVNDDSGNSSPTIDIGDASVVEGNGGTRQMTFTVSLSHASSQQVRVKYATSTGTAKTSDSDYVSKSGTITFNPGQTTKTITITIKGDKKKESDERFYINLSKPDGAAIDDGKGEGTIRNDDGSVIKRGHHPPSDWAFDAALDDLFNDVGGSPCGSSPKGKSHVRTR